MGGGAGGRGRPPRGPEAPAGGAGVTSAPRPRGARPGCAAARAEGAGGPRRALVPSHLLPGAAPRGRPEGPRARGLPTASGWKRTRVRDAGGLLPAPRMLAAPLLSPPGVFFFSVDYLGFPPVWRSVWGPDPKALTRDRPVNGDGLCAGRQPSVRDH